jgi:cytochrome c oxidase assembly factor CtaG
MHHHHHDVAELLRTWDVDHIVVWLLPIVAIVYARGFMRVRAVMPSRFPMWRLASFQSGLAIVFLAIASPLHGLGEILLTLHMAQHMLLTMAAPPLLWMGQPMIPILRGLPARAARGLLGPILNSPPCRRLGRAITHPAVCWSALALAIVVWHLPRCYELVLRSEAWHDVQHACFFTAALLFWWPIVQVWPARPVWPRWALIPYLVSADLINTAQSAVLSFSSHLLYPSYAHTSALLGLSPMDDQALAGVIMWVPGSIAFLVPAIVLTIRLCEPRRRVAARRPATMAAA